MIIKWGYVSLSYLIHLKLSRSGKKARVSLCWPLNQHQNSIFVASYFITIKIIFNSIPHEAMSESYLQRREYYNSRYQRQWTNRSVGIFVEVSVSQCCWPNIRFKKEHFYIICTTKSHLATSRNGAMSGSYLQRRAYQILKYYNSRYQHQWTSWASVVLTMCLFHIVVDST